MKKITFKNAPSTETPLSAENLNLMQNNAEEELNRINEELNTTKLEVAKISNDYKAEDTRINAELNTVKQNVTNLTAVELFRGRKASYEILNILNIKQYVRLELTFAPYTFQEQGNTGGAGNVLILDLEGATNRRRAGMFIPYFSQDPFTSRINKEGSMFWCLAEADIPGNRLVSLVGIDNGANTDAKGYALTKVVGYKKI